MRVLLINPAMRGAFSKRYSYFPTGLAYLLATLIKKGVDARILDFQAEPEKQTESFIQQSLSEFKPDIVGIGCLFSNYFPGLTYVSEIIKKIDPSIKTVIGGLHPTLFYDTILKDLDSIDYVLLGESEYTFLELCRAIVDSVDTEGIDGLACRRGREVKVTPKTTFIDDLDALPFPAFDRFNLANYTHHNRYSPFKKNLGMSVLTSRSCPNQCTFCSMFHSHGQRWRARSADNVLDEIEYLYRNHAIRHFMFMDDNMTFNKKRTKDIFQGVISRKLRITFDFPNGVSIKTLDREVMEIMKEAGCLEMALPIESGSEHMRNEIIKKSLSDKKIFEIIELCNEFKIDSIALFVLGMPGETHKTVEENINFVKRLRGRHATDFLSAGFATPFPGTELFAQCVREGLIDDATVKSLINGTIQTFDKPVINLKTMSYDELIEFRSTMHKHFVRQNFLRIAKKNIVRPSFSIKVIKALIKRYIFSSDKH